MGCCKCLFSGLINFTVIFLIVVLVPGLPPSPTFPFEKFSIRKPSALEGAYELNTHLNNASKIFIDKLDGAEMLISKGNIIYATTHTGTVVKIENDKITNVAQFGKPCKGHLEEKICGRPLGIAFDTQGDNLIVSDAYYGIWEVNLPTGKKTNLVPADEILPGEINRPAKLFNSVAVAKNGDIYWTESTSDYELSKCGNALLVNPSGRLFRYSRSEKKNYNLLDKLYFGNGLALSLDESFVVVAETAGSRLQKVHLKGAKKGTSEVFIDGLPGFPDNLTPDAEGIWIPLVVSSDPSHPVLTQSMTRLRFLRKFIIRVMGLIEMPIKLFDKVYPNHVTEHFLHNFGSFVTFSWAFPTRSTIVRVNWEGKVVAVMHGDDGTASLISHVLEFGDNLWLGTPFNNFVGRVKFVNKDLVHPKKN